MYASVYGAQHTILQQPKAPGQTNNTLSTKTSNLRPPIPPSIPWTPTKSICVPTVQHTRLSRRNNMYQLEHPSSSGIRVKQELETVLGARIIFATVC